jgi:hypothetical protein
MSTAGGGHLIELEDENPKVREMFKEELEKEDIPFNMPPVTYRR